jgi:hypothetical protein
LIDIEFWFLKEPNKLSYEYNGEIRHVYPREIERAVTEDHQILAATGSKGVVKGEISGSPYFIKLPFSNLFQEIRLVRLENTIGMLPD